MIIRYDSLIVAYNLCIGSDLEREAHDRSDIDLPGNQLKLLQDATEVAKSKQLESE